MRLVGSAVKIFEMHSVDKIVPFPDVIKSAIGLLVWFAGLTTWILIFQTYRASWGEIGDRISFVIPLGVA